MSTPEPATTLRRIDDRARLDAASADLEEAVAVSRTATAELHRIALAIGTDKISTDGVILDPFKEEDTIVRHVRAARGSVAG